MTKKIILLVGSFTLLHTANIVIEPSSEKLKMVITNKNLSLVNEKRNFKVSKTGNHKLIYKSVPSSLMTDTIVPTFLQNKGKDETTLYTQKYNYNTINFKNIIKHYLGKDVKFDEKRVGKLISLSPLLVQDKKDEKIKFVKQSSFNLTSIPDYLTIKPNLSWDIHTNAGNKTLDLLYLTNKINWKANYALKYDEKTSLMQLSSFITIKNNSGKAFKNVDLKLLSGNINVVKPIREVRRYQAKAMMAQVLDSPQSNKVTQKEFAGYHIYKIPFKVDINDQENSMIKFLDEKEIAAKKIYFANISNITYLRGVQKFKFSQALEFKVEKPLPAGKVTMYQKDGNEQVFIGSVRMPNNPKNEKIKLTYGQNFDLIGKITIKNREESSRSKYFRSDFDIELKNKSDKTKTVEFLINIPQNTRKLDFSSDCNTQKMCEAKKESYNRYKYKLTINANSTRSFSSHLEFYR